MDSTDTWVSKYAVASQNIFLSPNTGRRLSASEIPPIGEEIFPDEPLLANERTPLSGDTSDGAGTGVPYHIQKWRIFKRRIPYYVPVLSWLPRYQKENLFSDFIAGLTVGIMLVPQGLSYASLAGLPAIVGLYTSCVPVIVYALMGNSRQLSVGPEALVSILTGTTISELSRKHSDISDDDLPALAHVLSFLVGIFMLALGLLRFGFLSEVLSRPLVRGFIIAVALTIGVEQLDVMLGFSLADARGWHKIPAVINNISQVQWIAVALGVSSVLVLVVFKMVKKVVPQGHPNRAVRLLLRFPEILLVVILGIVLTSSMRLDKMGLPILGPNPSGLPSPVLPRLDSTLYVAELLTPAVIISIIGFVETMAVGKFFAAKHNYQLSANREFVALGVSNVIGSFFQAWPIFGSLTRSSVSENAGSKSQLAGFITAMMIVFTLLFLMPVFFFLPRVVMSSIILVAAVGLIDAHEIIFLWQVKAYKDLSLLVGTAIITFIYGAEVGLMVSVGASVFMVIKHTSVPHISILGKIPDTSKYKDITQFKEAETQNGVLILRVEESLHFANMGQLKEMLYRLESVGSIFSHPTDPAAPPLRAVIMDTRAIPHIDASSLLILLEMVKQYKARNIRVCFVRLREEHKRAFLNAGIMQVTGVENFFHSIHEAVNDVETKQPKKEYSSYQINSSDGGSGVLPDNSNSNGMERV